MKNKILLFILGLSLMVSCNNETDLYPLTKGSASNWYNSAAEIEMSLADVYRSPFWGINNDKIARDSDDQTHRTTLTSVTNGTQNASYGAGATLWANGYKVIGRMNNVIEALERPEVQKMLGPKILKAYMAEALFHRATQYGFLVTRFGDVVYTEKELSIDESFTMSRTPKEEVLVNVYRDLDIAAEGLPVSYGANPQRATKGMAYAFKARIAIRQSDYKIVAEAAKACMDLGVYELHGNYQDLHLATTRSSKEVIFMLARSLVFDATWNAGSYMPRTVSGSAQFGPSYEFMAAYLCTDGLPIDESPLYDPRNPFENRDPRMAATVVEVGKDRVAVHLGVDYNPSPYAVEVMNYSLGLMVKNNDSRVNTQHASYNGLLWNKSVGPDWLENSKNIEKHEIIMRYADVLLMYAEAKIELNEIDQSVLDAINLVRARAYNGSGLNYPAVTTTDQAKLRTALRVERRVEFVQEGLRYDDLIRWRIAEDVLNRPNYGLLADVKLVKSEIIDKDLWFFPGIPEIDENGSADYSALAEYFRVLSQRQFNKRQYLYAIPDKEILINKNLTQNEGY